MDENIINRDYFNIPIKLIADHMFDILREQSVLELGASDGWFTKHILDYTVKLCIKIYKSCYSNYKAYIITF